MKRTYSSSLSIIVGLIFFISPLYSQTSPNGQNIALLATVTVSATGSCYLGTCPASSGVNDGGPVAFWSGADQSSTGWVQLTLDKVYTLSKIRVFSQYWDASIYGTEGGLEYSVLVSTDASNWTVVRPASFALQRTDSINMAREDINFTPQSVRYIKVDITNSTGVASHLWRTAIREIEAGDANLPLDSWGHYWASSPNGQNIALLATVTVSATGSCYLGTCPASSGVNDGGPVAFWSGADQSSTGWVQLTLDKVYTLSKIRVFSQYWDASIYGTEGGLEYSVLVSVDTSSWTVIRPASFALHRTDSINMAREDINFTTQSVRYIKVVITNSTGVAGHLWRTAIWEIEAGDANLPLNSWGHYLTSVERTSSIIPKQYHLFQNYPNPFNPSTIIEFSIPMQSIVVLTVFNILGMETEILLNQNLAPGYYRTQWTPRNFSSGVYFYQLRTSAFTETKRLLLLR